MERVPLDSPDLRRSVGETLRRVRLGRGMTLRDVAHATGGAFPPSTVAGYERGERAISLERFRTLAELYRHPADRLLGEALAALHPERRAPLTVDLDLLAGMRGPEREAVAEYVHGVLARRRSYLDRVVALRAEDLEAIGFRTGLSTRTLVEPLCPASRHLGCDRRARRPGRGTNRLPAAPSRSPLPNDR
jgi:transcriptional regulator with XRE-family HTH domain